MSPAAHGRKADLSPPGRAARICVSHPRCLQLKSARFRSSRTQGKRGTRRGIALGAVVGLEDLDIEIGRQSGGSGAHQLEQHGDTDAGVGSDQQRDATPRGS